MSPNLKKTQKNIQYMLLFVTGMQYHAMIVIGQSLKNLEDVPITRPSTYFVTTFDILMSQNLENTEL